LDQQPPHIKPDASDSKTLVAISLFICSLPGATLCCNYAGTIEVIEMRAEAKILGSGIKPGRLANRRVNNRCERPHRARRR
ncbi:hypothetical protein, partial [Aeromonas australiensis]|uniref:hypothetical protein n=1 Tax=Aeromonas australiensis TaxID=1114880 RepID=UPI001ADFF470